MGWHRHKNEDERHPDEISWDSDVLFHHQDGDRHDDPYYDWGEDDESDEYWDDEDEDEDEDDLDDEDEE